MKIKDSVIVVTGGANGIGMEMAFAAARRGAKAIAIVDLEGDKAKIICDEVIARGSQSKAYGVDVSNEGQIEAMIADVETSFGDIDLFCSNAGVGFTDGPEWLSSSCSNENWQTCWDVNVMSHVFAARALLPKMIKRGHGYFLNTASAAGLLNQIGDASYSATKAAAVAFSENLSITHKEDGIGVSVLCPQGVKTRLIEAIDSRSVASDGLLEANDVAEMSLDAVEREEFLILPHESVKKYMLHKATDRERWLDSMRKFRTWLKET
jgi:NAD(P)-dependent dehydrogenase (short-subunit alcohol dehydrogenase family)